MTLSIAFAEAAEQKAFEKACQETARDLFPSRRIDEVFSRYSLPESQIPNIVGFLSNHPSLIQLLVQAVPYLEEIFGDARRYLEIDQDPDGGFREIFCVVVVKSGPEQALRLLRLFDEMWSSNVANDADNLLNFTVDTEDDEPV